MTLLQDITKLKGIEFDRLVILQDRIKELEKELIDHYRNWKKIHPRKSMPVSETSKRGEIYDRLDKLKKDQWIQYGKVEALKEVAKLIC